MVDDVVLENGGPSTLMYGNSPRDGFEMSEWFREPGQACLLDGIEFRDVESERDKEGNLVSVRAKMMPGGWPVTFRFITGFRSSRDDQGERGAPR
jgi:hypothetical protein